MGIGRAQFLLASFSMFKEGVLQGREYFPFCENGCHKDLTSSFALTGL